MTLEEYLRANSYPHKKTPDHLLRCEPMADGVRFYIHPANDGGDTINFLVKGNELLPDPLIVTIRDETE